MIFLKKNQCYRKVKINYYNICLPKVQVVRGITPSDLPDLQVMWPVWSKLEKTLSSENLLTGEDMKYQNRFQWLVQNRALLITIFISGANEFTIPGLPIFKMMPNLPQGIFVKVKWEDVHESCYYICCLVHKQSLSPCRYRRQNYSKPIRGRLKACLLFVESTM